MEHMESENVRVRGEFIKKLSAKNEKYLEMTETSFGLKKEDKAKFIKEYVKTSSWTLLGGMEKSWQKHKMQTVADFYNTRHLRALPEDVENQIGRKVIDAIFQDDKYYLTDAYKDILTKEHPEYMSERYATFLAYKNKKMPEDIIKEATEARKQIETAINMDIVTSFYSTWVSRRTTELYNNLLNCIELGPREMKKEDFGQMDKINAGNANKKVDICVDEMLNLRKITFEDFKREFKREEQNW